MDAKQCEPIGAAPSLRFTVALAIVTAAAMLWGVPRIVEWSRQHLPPLTATAQCLPPSEFEQLHIVVRLHEGLLYSECLYVGTAGTYTRKRR